MACPLHWKIIYLQDPDYHVNLIHELDIEENLGKRPAVWLWDVSSRDQWLDDDMWELILESPLRLQIMAMDAKYNWATDQVLRLTQSPYDLVAGLSRHVGRPKVMEQAKYHCSRL